ncbi:hypothetical protein [Burkholderia pseudomultivorans]|uniref:hypothetical protein n=1 Tax=Burkholderia pseudomultivorans TaxID=1207504 RepID=UPI00188F3B2D|nr:hypothetical protein [Burkholderia pseudomultivorans]MBF5008370.1 hypothetical protein [Burkholderia pseudomultivorans]
MQITPHDATLRDDAPPMLEWRRALASDKRLKVGLAWTCSLTHQRNSFRRVGVQRYADAFGDWRPCSTSWPSISRFISKRSKPFLSTVARSRSLPICPTFLGFNHS